MSILGGLSRRLALIVVVAVGAMCLTAGPAAAAPAAVTGVQQVTAQLSIIYVYSPSMNRVIPNQVLRPAGNAAGAPTFYLLSGKGGGTDGDSWVAQTDYERFFAGKKVNVVSPLGGRYSWYTDWRAADPVIGVNSWQTYLTHELPAVLDRELKANGRNAIAGLSMSGGPALDLAGQAPWLYRAVGSYSGCPSISSPFGMAAVSATVASGGANPFNMFGLPGDPAWVDHDPTMNPNRLRDKVVYLSAATGIPSGAPGLSAAPLFLGPSQVESITRGCTDQMAASLRRAGVAHTYRVFDTGAHTWGSFERQMRDSWQVIGPAIGA
ncbi:alpha/beta hydrolase family protein [Williamsia sp.]|uniref:alpha/beta hydrolase n=1 Tax=Williamsia sp. TaxID=1872085 RepID=UPI002F92EA9E